jgi:hypothetical protein
MLVDEDLAERMRVALAGTGAVREVRMFGGLCFMLNGNMVAERRAAASLSVSARNDSPMRLLAPTQSAWR